MSESRHGSGGAPESLQLAELTPRGPGGVSVLSLTGPGAEAALARLTGGVVPAADRPRVVALESGEEWIDEALVLRRATGFELHVHGSPAVVRRVAAELGLELVSGDATAGARPAALEERALALLARAPGESGARILLDQAEGALRRRLMALQSAPDADRAAGLAELAAAGRAVRRALEPARVVLAGPVNAGKSTLFNTLVGEERVVVSSELGTTRDLVEAPARLGAWPVLLVDAAGERAGATELELEGQVLAREERRRADLVLWLAPPGAHGPGTADPDTGAEAGPTVVLASRADELPPASNAVGPRIAPARDPEAARAVVEREFHRALGLAPEPWVPGAAVPFDAESRASVESLAAERDPQRLAAGLLELLGER